MIEPPENTENLPHRVSKHYYMMMAEMMGNAFQHDDYCCVATWMISKIAYDNGSDMIR